MPDPVGIVGYSDLELASHVCPPLTTVRVDAYALGYLAFRLVEEIWAGRVTMSTQIWMQPRLVVRSTTAGAREAEHVMEKEASSVRDSSRAGAQETFGSTMAQSPEPAEAARRQGLIEPSGRFLCS